MKRGLVMAIAVVACAPSEHRSARDKYNEGVGQLAAQNFEAAEKSLLEARSNAGVDPELRFRAAYNLGVAYDAHAQKQKGGKDADLGKALELEQQAVTWFSDAVRLKADDRDARENLVTARMRSQAMSDELSRGEGTLEKRLDSAIGQQRGVLDEARAAWLTMKGGGGADPLAQQATLTRLADRERGIVADVGVIADLASDEIDGIGKKPDDKRTAEERVRVVQLKNLEQYLEASRSEIAAARRKLQDLAAEAGVARAEASVVALKRAREQLLDPIQVLQQVARDQVDLVGETRAVAQVSSQKAKLATGSATAPEPPTQIPAWLQPPVLSERQSGLRDRVEEVRARVAAALDHADKPDGSGADAKPPQQSPEQAKLIAQLRLALPLVAEASAAMERARTSLAEPALENPGSARMRSTPDQGVLRWIEPALQSERDALVALAKAIEHFADLKQAIELAYGTQEQLVGLLSPEAAALPAAERSSQTKDGLAQNIARMGRIKQLLADEVAKLDQQKTELDARAQAAGSGSGSGAAAGTPDPKQLEAAKQQLDLRKQQMAAGEVYRREAEVALSELAKAIAANKDPLKPAKIAEAKLAELRKIFFSVIEHLQELVRQQSETKDQTSQANGQDDFTREPKLPSIAQRQHEHGDMATAIIDALASQADAGAAGPQQNPSQAKSFATAAAEVRLAHTEMTDANVALDKAADPKKTQSVSLQPAVDSQAKAIEHLENALRLLQPPSPQQNDQKDQQKQQDKKDQSGQQATKPDDKQPQQQGGAGQRARDQDAKRQRDRQKPGGDAVDQDW